MSLSDNQQNIASATAALKRDAANEILAISTHSLAGNQAPWQRSGCRIKQGQHYSLFADGRIHWSRRHPHLHGGPGFHLWARVSGGGEAVNVTRNSGSFVADRDGEIELGIYFGMWADAYGTMASAPDSYRKLKGTLEVCLVVWRSDVRTALLPLADAPNALVAAESQRLMRPVQLPPEWDYLPETGLSDIFTDCSEDDSSARICVRAADDQGIIRKPVDLPLTPATRLSWRWQLHEHPATEAEDSALSHDYVSLAAEFDNGRDLTWIWSSTLKPGHWFHCPIKAWQQRETHYVVRNEAPSGDWYEQCRNVYSDVEQSMGPPPSRIVAIWLIAVATFHHRLASASFEAIELSDGQQTLRVL